MILAFSRDLTNSNYDVVILLALSKPQPEKHHTSERHLIITGLHDNVYKLEFVCFFIPSRFSQVTLGSEHSAVKILLKPRMLLLGREGDADEELQHCAMQVKFNFEDMIAAPEMPGAFRLPITLLPESAIMLFKHFYSQKVYLTQNPGFLF